MAQVAALAAKSPNLRPSWTCRRRRWTFEPSAIEGTEAVGAGRAQGEGQPACGVTSPASSQSDVEARIPGLALPRLRCRCFGRRAEPLRELRPRRNPRDRARREASDAAPRRLPVLRQALQGGAATRPGTGIAVRTEPARGDLSALGPGHPAGAVERLLKDLFGLAVSEGALVNILGDSPSPSRRRRAALRTRHHWSCRRDSARGQRQA
jgi:hypothetical protein